MATITSNNEEINIPTSTLGGSEESSNTSKIEELENISEVSINMSNIESSDTSKVEELENIFEGITDDLSTKVLFVNENPAYFKSNETAEELKETIKNIYDKDKKKFNKNIKKQKKTLEVTYLLQKKIYTLEMEFAVDDKNKITVTFLKIDNVVEINKLKLKNKLAELKQRRGGTNFREKQQMKQKIKLQKSDPRVTKQMIDLYEKSKLSMNNVPTPLDILNDIQEYSKKVHEQITQAFLQQRDPKEKIAMLNNTYLKYLQLVTGVKQETVVRQIMEYISQMRGQQPEHVHGENCNHEHSNTENSRLQEEYIHENSNVE